MIQSTSGLILRTRPLTETSLIVHWLTLDCGRIATVAKGARRPRSPFLGKLDLFYEADLSFSRSRRSELHTLREVSVRDPHAAMRREIRLLQQASYCVRLVEQTTETETPLPGVYHLTRGLLAHLARQPPLSQTLFAFELKLLGELGLSPDPAQTHLSAGARQVANALRNRDWTELARLKLSEAQTRELGQFLHGFLLYHLGRIPPGRSWAE